MRHGVGFCVLQEIDEYCPQYVYPRKMQGHTFKVSVVDYFNIG